MGMFERIVTMICTAMIKYEHVKSGNKNKCDENYMLVNTSNYCREMV